MDFAHYYDFSEWLWTCQTTSGHSVPLNESDMVAPDTTTQATASALTFVSPGPTHVQTVARSRAISRQPRYVESQWDQHQEELRRLYLIQNKTLPWIMDFMSKERSFTATQKQYKDRFSMRGWQKNLPVEIAQFMVNKANKRKRGPESKDTIYEFGGLTWTTQRAEVTIKRAKRPIPNLTDMPTPDGVMYQTPFNEDEEPSEETAVTPHNSGHSSETVTNASPSSPNEEVWESGSEGEDDQLPLIWNGYTRSDIHALLRQAEEYARHGNSSRADVLFQNALKGYQHLVGPVHEETSKVAFTLATFYFEQGHLAKAYTLLEKNTQTHIKNLGIEHHRTQQHVADIGRLLHSWGKKDDADAFLDRAREAEEAIRAESRFDTNVHQKPWKAFIVAPPKAAPQLVIPGEIEGNRVQLMKTIEECEQNMNRLVAQSRKAWGELLKFPGEEKPRWY